GVRSLTHSTGPAAEAALDGSAPLRHVGAAQAIAITERRDAIKTSRGAIFIGSSSSWGPGGEVIVITLSLSAADFNRFLKILFGAAMPSVRKPPSKPRRRGTK